MWALHGPCVVCVKDGRSHFITINFTEETGENGQPLRQTFLCVYTSCTGTLQNVVKHSQAHNSCKVGVQNGQALLRVVDDGVGMGPEKYGVGGVDSPACASAQWHSAGHSRLHRHRWKEQ
jgi:hypothetical protein